MPDLPQNALVWAEIPVRDLDKGIAFYSAVLEQPLTKEVMGPNAMGMLPVFDKGKGIAGHLYVGKPAPEGVGPTVHLQVSGSVEAAADRWRAAGGAVISEPIEIPSGRFVYGTDPDGNSIGLFETT